MTRGALALPSAPLLAQRDRTLAEYAPIFLKSLAFVRKRSENTVRSYGEDLKTFVGFCEQAGLSKPDDVSFRHIEFYNGLVAGGARPPGVERQPARACPADVLGMAGP